MTTTTDEMRAKLDAAYREAQATGVKSSVNIDRDDLVVIVRMDLEDALKALGTSRRVLKTRAILVDAMKACDTWLKDMRADKKAQDADEQVPEMPRASATGRG